MRTRLDANARITAKRIIELSEGQEFYQTPKAYELWDLNPLRRVKRIPKQKVFWIVKDGMD